MEADLLIRKHPKLYHMAEDGSWESIQKIGLLSTSALLDKFEIAGERRQEIKSSRRPKIVEISHPELGRALIRDNKHMHEKTLERCLVGMTPREWYETLNRKVFFWLEEKRLINLLGARAYRDRPHLVLEVETAELLRRHGDSVSLSPTNSGVTFTVNPAPRGPDTFKHISDHPKSKAVVELTVDYAVPNLAAFTLSVSRWHGSEKLENVWLAPSV